MREEKMKKEGTEKEERREKELLSNLPAHRLVGGREKRMRAEERIIRGDQAERERAGRDEENGRELLSYLPVNRCNRCNQLCLQVKREARQHQSQQSASGWGQGLGKLLCRGAACNSEISPVPGSVIETPRCPAITPDPASSDGGTAEIYRNTQAGEEDGRRDEERRNLRETEIRVDRDGKKENVCNLAISRVSFPCRGAAWAPEICLVPLPCGETACDPAISLVPASFRETACSQRQTIPAGDSDPALGLVPHCFPQEIETEAGMRSACADTTLAGNEISKGLMSNGSVRSGNRKRPLPEAGATNRKKRKRGRRQTRRVGGEQGPHAETLAQNSAGIGLKSDLCVSEALKLNAGDAGKLLDNRSPLEDGDDCGAEDHADGHLLCRTKCCQCHKTSDRQGTFHSGRHTRNTTDTLNNLCDVSNSSGGGGGDTNDCGQFCPGGERRDCWTEKPSDNPRDQDNRTDQIKDYGDQAASANTHKCNHCFYCNDAKSTSDKLHTDNLGLSVSAADRPLGPGDGGSGRTELVSVCNTADTQTDSCNCNATNESNNGCSCIISDACNHISCYNQSDDKSGERKDHNQTKTQCHIQLRSDLSDAPIDHNGIDRRSSDAIGSGQCNPLTCNHAIDCNDCDNVVDAVDNRGGNDTEPVSLTGKRAETKVKDGEQEKEQKEEEKPTERREERETASKRAREQQEGWGKELANEEKERGRWKARELEKERSLVFEHLYPEKRPRFPHSLPPPCIPLHAPLLLRPAISSSSSFSFRHTIIQHHHLNLLPPPSHLPMPSYPHLLPSFSPHLSPLALHPPPPPPPLPPPSFYASSSISLLDPPGPFPLGTTFHPMQGHHPSLYPQHHPALLNLQVLFS